jgi:putative hydrolase
MCSPIKFKFDISVDPIGLRQWAFIMKLRLCHIGASSKRFRQVAVDLNFMAFLHGNWLQVYFSTAIFKFEIRGFATMLEVDFHSHTFFSKCGLHSIIEMLTEAKNLGLAALAITDHGPMQQGGTPSTFYDRLANPVPGILLLKGLECNIASEDGAIDFPQKFLKYADIILLGLHPHLPANKPRGHNTAMLVRALDKNPFVDIVTHPEDVQYPVAFNELAGFAKEHGIALECNNSKILNNRVAPELMIELLDSCKRIGCRIAVNSDAHALSEIGRDDSVRPLLAQVGFPEDLIVNRDANSAFAFVEERRAKKLNHGQSQKGK